MAYEQRDMSGSIFKNKRKEKETHPNSEGSAMIDGVEYWVKGWTKTDKNGDPWISLAFKRKEEKPAAPDSTAPGHPALADLDSDIPF